MAARGLLLGLLAVLGGTLALAGASERPDAAKISTLVEQLGGRRFADREKASAELEKIGPPALEVLRKAAKSRDVEVSRRAGELVQKIARRARTEAVLAPTRVRLSYKDTPVGEAIADLAKRSGYTIVLREEDKAKLRERRVTLQTEEVSFWEAYDRFCRAANLVEAAGMAGAYPMRGMPGQPGMPRGPGGRGRLNGRFAAPAPGGVAVAAAAGPPAAVLPAPAKEERNVQKNAPAPLPPAPVLPAPAAPAVPMQPLPPVRLGVGGMAPAYMATPQMFVLTDGKPEGWPTAYAGALRIRARGDIPGTRKGAGEILLGLEVNKEPRIPWLAPMDVRAESVVDDQGRKLIVSAAAGGGPVMSGAEFVQVQVQGGQVVRFAQATGRPTVGGPGTIFLRIKEGDGPSKAIKELKAVLSAQVQPPVEALLKVDDVFKGVGKTVQAEEVGSLKVVEAAREDDGTVRLRVRTDMPNSVHFGTPAGWTPPGNPGGAVVGPGIMPRMLFLGLGLEDVKGHRYGAVNWKDRVDNVAGGRLTREITLFFQPVKDEPAPARLVFYGTRTVDVAVPFTLKDVALP